MQRVHISLRIQPSFDHQIPCHIRLGQERSVAARERPLPISGSTAKILPFHTYRFATLEIETQFRLQTQTKSHHSRSNLLSQDNETAAVAFLFGTNKPGLTR
jgi:hypothetical protein